MDTTEEARKRIAALIDAERMERYLVRRFSDESADESVRKEADLQRLYRMVMGHEYEGATEMRRKVSAG